MELKPTWNHNVCIDCWNLLNPNMEPFRLKAEHRTLEKCCLCASLHNSGIYIRHTPNDPDLKCRGVHYGT